ncbi:hypothetical protein RCO28_22570 [Streptomyces sp. LHD-70]|uniref:hypothetical protein n=1 Tax=Streptomyces sp. LHD-70 TaxID=3072140 RepID=UPI00280EC8B0|nr:hypothetical protein [Streptomyces sp. LHD-70]MDQ8705259.1 hypothetical protein [Streptomyces sp. LHD-70]
MRGQQWALDTLELPGAWGTAKGDDTVIAVVDSGADLEHPDLKGRLVHGHDFVDGDDEPPGGVSPWTATATALTSPGSLRRTLTTASASASASRAGRRVRRSCR